jgi:hypothetical protein
VSDAEALEFLVSARGFDRAAAEALVRDVTGGRVGLLAAHAGDARDARAIAAVRER